MVHHEGAKHTNTKPPHQNPPTHGEAPTGENKGEAVKQGIVASRLIKRMWLKPPRKQRTEESETRRMGLHTCKKAGG